MCTFSLTPFGIEDVSSAIYEAYLRVYNVVVSMG